MKVLRSKLLTAQEKSAIRQLSRLTRAENSVLMEKNSTPHKLKKQGTTDNRTHTIGYNGYHVTTRPSKKAPESSQGSLIIQVRKKTMSEKNVYGRSVRT